MGKNLQRVQDMLDGNYKNKIQVGYTHVEPRREVGDRWVDSDGNEWEQRKGYKMKISKNPGRGIADKCSDCESYIFKSYDKDTYMRMGRCYKCQTTFELDLKFMKIGENGNKWQFWVRLQELQRWISGRKELEQWVEEQHLLQNEKVYTNKVANAMANANVEMEINKNKV